jgi:tyrosine-protein phosphatase YwqE
MFDGLKSLFGVSNEEKKVALTDYSAVGVDLHSHLIPGIDDGSKSLEDSMAILREFKALGFKKIITTPHVIRDSYNNSTETLLNGKAQILAAIAEEKLNIEFDVSAEYYMDETIYERIEKKDFIPIGKNYVLVELSYLEKMNNTSDLFYKLQVAGYKIILAHPERYPFYYEKDFHTYKSFKDRNIYFQLNIGSLLGKYGGGAKQTAQRMIDENMIDFISSDLHTIKSIETLRECLQDKYLQKLVSYPKLLNKTLL